MLKFQKNKIKQEPYLYVSPRGVGPIVWIQPRLNFNNCMLCILNLVVDFHRFSFIQHYVKVCFIITGLTFAFFFRSESKYRSGKQGH